MQRRVERAEHLVEGRIEQVQMHRRRLGAELYQAITPGRIVVAGLLAGFVVGRARPMRTIRAVSATRWLQLATSLSGLFASLKAAYAAQVAETAAEEAEHAADSAEAVAEDAGAVATDTPSAAPAEEEDAAPSPASDARRRHDAPFEREPRPAEAATEISER
jgi:hypothetical protein